MTGATRQFPPSYGQEWMLRQLAQFQEEPAFQIPLVVRLQGNLEVDHLYGAIQRITNRHEILRTSFAVENGALVQVVHPRCEISLETANWPVDRRSADNSYLSVVKQHVCTRLLIDKPSLARYLLLKINVGEYILAIAMHHLITDTWSLGIFANELLTYYRALNENVQTNLPPMGIQYGDYSVWERKHFVGDERRRFVTYWRNTLQQHGMLNSITRSATFEYRSHAHDSAREYTTSVSTDLCTAFETLARREKISVFCLLLALCGILCMRLYNSDELAIAVPISGRYSTSLFHLIGFFVNTIPVCISVDLGATLRETTKRVAASFVEAHANGELNIVQVEEDLGINLSCPVMFNYVADADPPTAAIDRMAGIAADPIEMDVRRYTRRDLTVIGAKMKAGMRLTAIYNGQRFTKYEIASFMGAWSTLSRLVATDGTVSVCEALDQCYDRCGG